MLRQLELELEQIRLLQRDIVKGNLDISTHEKFELLMDEYELMDAVMHILKAKAA